MKRTLAAAGAVLAVLLIAGCSDDPAATPPSATSAPAGGAETQGPAAGTVGPTDDAAGQATIAADDVTEAQKKACLDAMIEQLREKKGGSKPQECVILPEDVVGPLVMKALNGG